MFTLEIPEWLGWATGVLSFLSTVALMPLVIRMAKKMDWMAHPKADRWHEASTALMGGIGIYAGFSLSMFLLLEQGPALTVWLGATVLFGLGLVDDLKNVRPVTKLVGQIIAAGILIQGGYLIGETWPLWLSLPVTFIWLVGITNAFNLLDNMDGLAGGIAAISSLAIAIYAALTGHPVTFSLALCITGASLAFLVYNFNPAKIFMGDCGSMFLGFTIAALSLTLVPSSETSTSYLLFAAPLLMMAVPIFDTTLVSVVRTFSGRSIAQGGRDHSSHRLVFVGLSEKEAVMTLYAISALFGGLALAGLFTDVRVYFGVASLLFVALVLFGVYLGSINVYQKQGDLGFFTTKAYERNERFFSFLHAFLGRQWKASFGVLADLLLVSASFILAHYLKYDQGLDEQSFRMLARVVPLVVGVKVGIFYLLGLYNAIWRHAGTPEFLRIVLASVLGSTAVLIMLALFPALGPVATAVVVIDFLLLSFCLAASRFGFRALRQYLGLRRTSGKRVILYGAGDAGLLTLRELRQNPELGLVPIGFVDDDPLKHQLKVQGLNVVGSFKDLERIIHEMEPESVLISASRMTDARKAEINTACSHFGVECRTFRWSLDHISPIQTPGKDTLETTEMG